MQIAEVDAGPLADEDLGHVVGVAGRPREIGVVDLPVALLGAAPQTPQRLSSVVHSRALKLIWYLAAVESSPCGGSCSASKIGVNGEWSAQTMWQSAKGRPTVRKKEDGRMVIVGATRSSERPPPGPEVPRLSDRPLTLPK